MADEEAVKRVYREFLDLLPLTLALAGLSSSEGQRNFTTDQLDELDAIIAIPDQDMLSWATRQASIPSQHFSPLLIEILSDRNHAGTKP